MTTTTTKPITEKLPYDLSKLPRELQEYYISMTEEEINDLLKELNLKSLDDLYSHISNDVKFKSTPQVTDKLDYQDLINHVKSIAKKNKIKRSFIGDGLKNYKVPSIVPFVSDIRGLTTAYTPYQPERSQGSLEASWIYQSTMSMLTGFEAINASMYDRSTCLFEAFNATLKLIKDSNSIIVCDAIYPGDKEVINTLSKECEMKIYYAPVCSECGVTTLNAIKETYAKASANGKVAAIAYPQINTFGNLENVHEINDWAHENKIKTIAIIDPMTLSTDGLIEPVKFGKDGADLIVGEGQHLALAPNLGGPGLGIFGIRFNANDKNSIRSTSGRFVGKAKDIKNRDSLCMVLSTREQHIRREKASSNICSNQAFIATLAGAAIMARGEKGMIEATQKARDNAVFAFTRLIAFKGVRPAFNNTPFFNEFVLELPCSANDLIKKADQNGINLGVDVSNRAKGRSNLLLLSFFDVHEKNDIEELVKFFEANFERENKTIKLPEIPKNLKRETKVALPNLTEKELKDFYTKLGAQNVSPDDVIYPLGSCTMKYNPYVNDYLAGLKEFTDVHPEAPIEDIQGSLEILYEIQEMFKKITGLPALTTQPVAGAQGELAGIKMIQAYHRDHGEGETRNIILIPHSAHGTNPATASMAGFESKVIDGIKYGIELVEANQTGQIDFDLLKQTVEKYNKRIAGIMVTNPNTSGIFEVNFKKIADLIHSVGGLVYMDGANMNAIAGWVNIASLGVDAIHNNLHKTWSISHGGGGPGDTIVAVSEKLADFLPGVTVVKNGDKFELVKAKKSIGSFHRHFGNFAHKIRCYAYLKALGSDGIKKMSAISVLSARYLHKKLSNIYPTLPVGADKEIRMHEFILTLSDNCFNRLQEAGVAKSAAIARVGKLFLDFGLHAPTVAFPEVFGLMIEPTESFTKSELDRFIDTVKAMKQIIEEHPEYLNTVPHFTPVDRVDEVWANKALILSEKIEKLNTILPNRIDVEKLGKMKIEEIINEIGKAHKVHQ